MKKKEAAALRQLARVLAENIAGSVSTDVPLSRYTSYRLGGPADVLVTPRTVDDVAYVMGRAYDAGAPVFVVGGGSNLLVADAGVRGVVLRIGREMNDIRFDDETVTVEAGAPLPRLAKMAAQRGLAGLEFAGGIPGTVGGALAMNAGAHADSVGDVVETVDVVDCTGRLRTLNREKMGFAYRMSRLQTDRGLVAVRATLRLQAGTAQDVREKTRAYLQKRRQTQPLGTYNAGSVFKNPPGDFAGRLLERAGCKGMVEGDAIVSPMHANFIINRGKATAEDVRRLVHRTRRRVYEEFGVWLEPEVQMLGFA